MHRKLFTLNGTFCVVTVTTFILVSISGFMESLPILMLMKMVWRSYGQYSHICSVIPDDASWLCGFRQPSLYLSLLARNRS